MIDEKTMKTIRELKSGIELVELAYALEQMEKKWKDNPEGYMQDMQKFMDEESAKDNLDSSCPCCEEKPFEKYAKKLNTDRESEQKEEIEKLKKKVKAIEEELAVMREHRHMIYCSNITASPYKPIDHCNCGF